MSVKFIAPKVYVDLNNDGDFGDANEDFSGEVYSVIWSRGRSSVFDSFSMGTARVAIINSSGDYSPFDSGAATYPNLVPGRQVKIETNHDSTDYGAFYGRLAEIEQGVTPDGKPLVILNLEDEFGRMGRSRYRTFGGLIISGFATDYFLRTASHNAGIWENYGYSAGEYTYEAGKSIFETGFWFDNGSHLSACKLVEKQELAGAFFMAVDGKPTFYNRHHNSQQSVHATFAGMQALYIQHQQSDYYDTVVAKRGGLSRDVNITTLFTLSPLGRAVEEGSTAAANTFGGEYHLAAQPVTQPVPGTDFTVNTLADGSGEDLTDQVSVSAFTAYGGGFTITLDNASGQAGVLTSFIVRGKAVRVSAENREIVETNASAPVENQTLREEFRFIDDVEALRGYAKARLAAGSAYYPRRIKLRLIPRTDAEAVKILGLELLKKITITNTSGLYPSQIDDDFFVQAIKARSIPGGLIEFEIDCWHKIASFGNFFRISGTTNYSTIAGDAATTGDPVAF